MNNKLASRNSALDITRIVAMFTVISVHFFLNNGFYSAPMLGKRMAVATVVRTGFMVCVPLFIMLTGYLMNRKELSRYYYKGIVKTLGIYVLASLAHVVYKVLVLNWELTSDLAFWGILNFTTANYSWYIEMYIGLFLIIPFLNAMWKGLGSREKKLALVVTLFVLTSLPSFINVYNFTTPDWWKTPYLSTSYREFLPDWWTRIYPFTYYFLGAYLREFPLKLKQWQKLTLFVASVGVFGMYNYWRSWGGFFAWMSYNDWMGLPTLVMTFLLFAFLTGIKTEKYPLWLKKALMVLSDLALGAYLCSYIFDNLIYAELNSRVPEVTERFKWYFVIVPAVFVCSLALSGVLNLIWSGLSRLAGSVWKGLNPVVELPTLETARLTLRTFRMSDAKDLYSFASDADVARMTGFKVHASLADSRRMVKIYRKIGEYAIVERESGRVIGTIGLRPRRRDGLACDAELGYMLAREWWGRGLMPEAAGALLKRAFESGARSVAVAHFPDNMQSKRVIEKLGFEYSRRYERSFATPDGERVDEVVYVLTAGRFASRGENSSQIEHYFPQILD